MTHTPAVDSLEHIDVMRKLEKRARQELEFAPARADARWLRFARAELAAIEHAITTLTRPPGGSERLREEFESLIEAVREDVMRTCQQSPSGRPYDPDHAVAERCDAFAAALASPQAEQRQEGDGFGADENQIKALLNASLKPEEIAGDPAKQQDRVRELIHWFARLTRGSANPKWTTSHACELAYYIATTGGNRHINLQAVRDAAFKEGLNVSPSDRALLERLGIATPHPGPAATQGDQQGASLEGDAPLPSPLLVYAAEFMEGWLADESDEVKRNWKRVKDAALASGASPIGVQAAQVSDAVAAVLAELERATTKFPTWPTDPLHAVAVLGEEFGELVRAVLQVTYEPHKATPEDVATEAMQTAAMALRFVASLGSYAYARCPQHKQGEAA